MMFLKVQLLNGSVSCTPIFLFCSLESESPAEDYNLSAQHARVQLSHGEDIEMIVGIVDWLIPTLISSP